MKTYTIRQVCEMTGFSASTLRYYEEEKILRGIERTGNKQRIYTDEHIGVLNTLKCFKGTGMSMKQLKQFFLYQEEEPKHLEEIIALLCGQKEKVLKDLEQLQADLDKVERKISYYTAMRESHEAGEKLPEWKDFIVKESKK